MSLLTPRAYPTFQTQPRDPFRLFGSTPKPIRYIFYRQNDGGHDIQFFTENADIYIKAMATYDAYVYYSIDFTKLTVLSLETAFIYGGSGSARIAIGGSASAIFTTSATHDWTRRSFDLTSHTGTKDIWFYNNAGGEFSLRDIRLY